MHNEGHRDQRQNEGSRNRSRDDQGRNEFSLQSFKEKLQKFKVNDDEC